MWHGGKGRAREVAGVGRPEPGLASGKTRGPRRRKREPPGSRALPLFGPSAEALRRLFPGGGICASSSAACGSRKSTGLPRLGPAAFMTLRGPPGAFPAADLVERRFHNVQLLHGKTSGQLPRYQGKKAAAEMFIKSSLDKRRCGPPPHGKLEQILYNI